MFIMMLMSMFFFLIANVLIILSNMVSKKMKINYEKMTPFESGFNPKINMRLPFSLRFFLITIIFLIFDVEIALLIPMLNILLLSNYLNWMLTSILFMIILLIGLIYEWNLGALNWI